MKVILKRDVDSLGTAGDVVDVADGYGHNYLLPRGLALRATKGAVADAAAIRRARAKREAATREQAEQLRASLEERPVTITARAGEDGTLYGSVGNTKIARALSDQRGIAVDKRKIRIDRPLKTVGSHEVAVQLHGDVHATVSVDVVAGDE